MDFSEALPTLKAYTAMTRDAWDGQNKTVQLIAGELGADPRFVQWVDGNEITYDLATVDILAADWKEPPPPPPPPTDGGVVDTGAEGAGTGGG
jgi:hypothetical protein